MAPLQAWHTITCVMFHFTNLSHGPVQETLRPEFEDIIQHNLRTGSDDQKEKKKKIYTEIDRATGETVLTRPSYRTLFSLSGSFSVLCCMVGLHAPMHHSTLYLHIV